MFMLLLDYSQETHVSYSIFSDANNGAPGLSTLSRVLNVFSASKVDNYLDYTQVLRVTPTTIVDSDLELVPYIKDVLMTTNALMAGLYLQAASLMCTVGRIDIRRHLDQLNPNRKPLDNLLNSAKYLVGESDQPMFGYFPTPPMLDQNAYKLGLPGLTRLAGEDNFYTPDERNSTSSGGDSKTVDNLKEIRESNNLVSGIILSVPISDGKHEVVVHPIVQLAITMLDSEELINVLDPTDSDKQLKYRWRKSRISKNFLEAAVDMVTCKDMLEKERRKMLKDKNGIYQESHARMRRNFFSGVFSGAPSIAQCSSVAIINETTATKLELAMDASLDNFNSRQRIFASGGYMMLVVVDRTVDRITFYYQNIVEKNTVRPDDIKSKGGGNSGPNINEILTAFRASSAPVF